MFGTLTTEKGKVLIVTAEDERDELRRRLYDVAKARGLSSVPSDSVHVLDFHDASATLLDKDAAPTEFSGRLLDFIVQHGPYALVVLDPVARLAGASIDKDNGNASALIAMFEAVSTAAGGLVVGIHHTSLNARKTGLIDAAALRGATVLGDNSRMVLFLGVTELEFDDPDVAERLGELVTLSCVKANYVRKWKPIDLRRGEHGELLPLDDFDKDLVAAARRRAEPEAAREAARAARRETLERAQVERVSKDAAAVRAYVLAHPGCSVREARLHATGDKADRWGAAIAHLGAELLQTRTGQGTRVGLTIVEAP
jgi:RecA-family ATPase